MTPHEVLEIRPLASPDVEATIDLFLAVAGEGRWILRELPMERDESRAFLQGQLDDPARTVLLAIHPESGEPVGQIGLSEDLPGVVHLGMLVADGWRGRGVGSSLLEAGLDWARGRGAHKVALEVWPHNERAIRLYEKYEFEQEGRLRQHYRRRNGDLWDAIVMGLVLA